MTKKHFSAFLGLLLLWAAPFAFAETPSFSNATLFNFGFRWGDGVTLEYQGLVSGTAFGLDQRLAERLNLFPSSRKFLQRYQTLDAWGNGLLWGGLGVAVGGVLFSNAGVNASGYVVTGTILTGLVGMLLGELVQTSAQDLAASAADAYNDFVLSSLSKAP